MIGRPYSLVATVLNVVERCCATVDITLTAAAAINAPISPYSIAVTSVSFCGMRAGGGGMLVVETVGRIGREHLVKGRRSKRSFGAAGGRADRDAGDAAQRQGGGGRADCAAVIQRDEARWRAMLPAQLKRLGAEPSARVGAFFKKAMAVADLGERIVFLNRG